MRAGYAERMTGSRVFVLLWWFFIASGVCAQPPQNGDSSFAIKPAYVEAGSPELITVVADDASSVEGEWLGHKLEFFRRDGKWMALTGVDVEAKPEASTVHITIQTAKGASQFNRSIEIHPAHYRTGRLAVAPKFVEPGPEEQKEIAAESEIKAKIFASSAGEPLWKGSFRAPVKASPTDSFGTRRMFNGKLASIHKGMDFRAPSGTVVRASNSGTVVLARHLFFEGNCVIIDHGLGLYTLSMHFSRIDVREGQHVTTGDRLGLSGATGRVTGPHLHWAVRWQNAYLDPAKLLRLNLSTVH